MENALDSTNLKLVGSSANSSQNSDDTEESTQISELEVSDGRDKCVIEEKAATESVNEARKIVTDGVQTENFVRLKSNEIGELVFVEKTGGIQKETVVTPKSCFPWSEPLNYFSLQNDEDDPVYLVKEFEDLDFESREALLLSLSENGFLFRVEGVESIQEEFEIRHWKVKTKNGIRTIQTAIDSWPRKLGTGEFLVEDIAGDIFLLTKDFLSSENIHPELEALVS